MENCEQRRILVIEDSKGEREILMKYLGAVLEDTVVLEAASWNSKKGAKRIFEKLHREGKQLDLVLTDFELGDVTGLLAIYTCRLDKIPVILMSKGSNHPDFAEAREKADEFIEKPLSLPAVRAMIEEKLGMDR